MDYNIRFTLTEDLQLSAARDYFWGVLVREKLGLGIFLVLAIGFAALVSLVWGEPVLLVFVLVILAVVLAMWVKTYMGLMAVAKANLRLLGGSEVELRIFGIGL